MTRPSWPQRTDLAHAAAVIALAIGMVAVASLLYALVDLLIAFFLGIVVAAALQPWHTKLVRFGVPRGLAVLLIYLLFLSALLAVGVLVEPVVVEQISAFLAGLPGQYAEFRATLRSSATPLMQTLGRRLPVFEALPSSAAALSPGLYERLLGVEGLFGLTTGLLGFLTYFVTVLAVGFYWTMEVPRIERLVLSLTPVARRAQVLDTWHEIEAKLGAFIRGQAIAMVTVGFASGIGYALIGLPNVLALAVLAGLCEAVPLVGPTLAAVPALLVALPLGLPYALGVLAWTVLVQVIENNVLIPRIMSRTVGISALLGIFAVLAFGILYGVVGVFVAIPLTAVIQVLFDRLLINAEVPTRPTGVASLPLERLRARARALRQQARGRLRGRKTRMGADADTIDHVVDAVDQEIERAVERVEAMISAAESATATAPDAHEAIVGELHGATEHIEGAVQHVETAGGRKDAPNDALPVEEPINTTDETALTNEMGRSGPTGTVKPIDPSIAAAQATSPAQRAAVEKLKQAEQAVERAEAKIAEVESSQRKHTT